LGPGLRRAELRGASGRGAALRALIWRAIHPIEARGF
jgi:hypothetical protein